MKHLLFFGLLKECLYVRQHIRDWYYFDASLKSPTLERHEMFNVIQYSDKFDCCHIVSPTTRYMSIGWIISQQEILRYAQT